MDKQDYFLILEALLSCKTREHQTVNRYSVVKEQQYTEKLVDYAINTLSKYKPKS